MKRFYVLLCFILIMLSAGCRLPVSMSAATPSEDAKETPLETDMSQADLSGSVQFSEEERNLFKSLWPLKTYAPSDMGSLLSIDMMTFGDSYMMTMGFSSEKPFDELRETLTDYIGGEWLGDDTKTYTFDGAAEGNKMLSSLEDKGDIRTIDLTFSLNTRYSEVESLLMSHWPQNAIELPDELADTKPDNLSFLVNADKSSITCSWTISDYDDVMEWFINRYDGADNYAYTEDHDLNSRSISFRANGLNVEIDRAGIFNTIMLEYSAPTVAPNL